MGFPGRQRRRPLQLDHYYALDFCAHHLAIFFVIPENFYRDLFITHTNFVSLLSSLSRFSTNGISIYTLYIELYGFCANPAVMVVFSFEDYKKKYGVVFSLPEKKKKKKRGCFFFWKKKKKKKKK